MTLLLLLNKSQIKCDEFGFPNYPEPPDPRIEETLFDIDESYMDVLEEEFYEPMNSAMRMFYGMIRDNILVYLNKSSSVTRF